MPVNIGPFESQPFAVPVQGRQRYWRPVGLGFDALVINVTTPATIIGNRINLEGYQVATLYATVAAGGGVSVRLELGCLDLDDTTLLRTELLSAGAAVGATSAFDFGTGASALLRGRVFRVHDLRASKSSGIGAPDPVLTLRLFARS